MECIRLRSRSCPDGDHSDGRLGRVREGQGGEAGVAHVAGRGCPVHNTCAGGQTGTSRRIFQWLGENATPMKIMDSSGLWLVDVPLKEGEHTFMYLIDGTRWITPPLAEDFVTDGFGQVNGVVIVR